MKGSGPPVEALVHLTRMRVAVGDLQVSVQVFDDLLRKEKIGWKQIV